MAAQKPQYLKLEQIEKGFWAFNHPPEWVFFDYQFNKARDAERAGDIEEATEIYLQIIEGCPDHLPARNNLGSLFCDQGDLEAAISAFEETTAIGQSCFPTEFDTENDKIPWYWEDNRPYLLAYENLGKCYLEMAINTFEDLNAINPDYRGISDLINKLRNLDKLVVN